MFSFININIHMYIYTDLSIYADLFVYQKESTFNKMGSLMYNWFGEV